jgi:hypothetical protein
MTFPYPIPGVTAPPPMGPYYQVGNLASGPDGCCDCANGQLTVDVSAKTLITFDYTQQLPTGVTIETIAYDVAQMAVEMLVVTDITLVGSISTFQVSGGVVGTSYVITATTKLSSGEIWIDRIVVTVQSCNLAPYTGPGLLYGPAPVIISSTLYYKAIANQIVFDLGIPDQFGRVGLLSGNNVNVYSTGDRIVPIYDYLVSVANNQITLLTPTVVGQEIVIDILSVPPPPSPPAPPLGAAIKMEYLPIATINVIPPLSYAPDGNVMMLFVSGTAFFPIGPDIAFTISDNTLTWVSTIYSVPPGAAVIAVYTHV